MGVFDVFLDISQKCIQLCEKTVFFKVPFLDTFVTTIAEAVGMRDDYIRLLTSMMLSYPLILICTLFRNPTVKKSFNLICGVCILQFCFGGGWIHSLISSTIVLILLRTGNPKKRPLRVFIFSLLYLSLSSLYTMLTDYMSYTLDSTTYQMMHISRFQMLAWSLYDGMYDREKVDKGSEQTDRWGRIYKRRQAEYVTEFPSLLDYYSFVFHFPGLLGGPNTFYREYIDVMNNVRYPDGKLPSSRLPHVLKCFLLGWLNFGIFIAGSIYLPISYLLSEEYGQRSLIARLWLMYVTLLAVRFRYYGLWKLGESLCVFDGFGEQPNGEWNGISNIDIIGFETTSNMSSATRFWNKRTQKWLQMCIYERSNFNQFAVFMVSAFWHGFYPAYYFCFGLGSILQYANHHTSRKLWPYVKDTKWEWLYLRIGNICVMICGSFMFEAMNNYSFELAWLGWKRCSFVGFTGCVVAAVILTLLPYPPKDMKAKKE